MADRETDVFYAAMIDDELGEGIRLQTQDDAVYEMRGDGVMETRLYGEEDEWHVKARIPVDGGEEDAYEVFRDIIYDLGDTYDEDVTVPALAFMEGNHRRDLDFMSTLVTARYNAEEDVDISVDLPDERIDWVKASARSLGTYTAKPAAVGGGVMGGMFGLAAAITAAGDPALSLAGAGIIAAVTGGGAAALAGLGGAGAWGWKEGYPVWKREAEDARFEHHPGGRTKKWKHRFKEKREQKKIEEGRNGVPLQDDTFLNRLNERNRLAATVDEVDDYEEAERFRELDESGIQAMFDAAMTFQFTGFEDRDGVTLAASTTSYREAAELAADIVGSDTQPQERPTLYHDRDAFVRLFEAAPEADRERMVAAAMEDATEDVTDYLDANHAQLVERIGQEQNLYGEDGGQDA